MNDTTVVPKINLDDPSTYSLLMQDPALLARFANVIWDELDRRKIPFGDRDDKNAERFALAALEPLQTTAGYVDSVWYVKRSADFASALRGIKEDYLSSHEEDQMGDCVTTALAARDFDWPDIQTDEDYTRGQEVYRAIVRSAAMALQAIAAEQAQAERV